MIFIRLSGAACALALAFTSVNAAAQSMPDHQMKPGMVMGMDMSAMMRPDAMPPAAVVGGMYPKAGRVMTAAGFMHMDMQGNRDGTDSVSTSEVLAAFPVAPLAMDMEMAMAGVMYGVTDDFSIMGMTSYVWKSMPHVTRGGKRFTTTSEGIGDVRLLGTYRFWRSAGHNLAFTAGLSLPTGSTDERDATPAGPDQVLPYPMQIGSGTFDLLPAVTYTGRSQNWSWGGQAQGVLRLGRNDEGYALGDTYTVSLWIARRWSEWLSSSLRLTGEVVENIDGADQRLNPAVVPTADPDLRGGEILSVNLGVNVMVPSGPLMGTRFAVEGGLPVLQRLDGPQVERDYTVSVKLMKAF